jgi:argininosuccinate lyase
LEDLSPEALREIDSDLPVEALATLQPEASVRSRESFGGPGPTAMEAQIRRCRELLEEKHFTHFH